MPTTDWQIAFFRRAFLRHAPQRYALMLSRDEADRLGQKYVERRGAISDAMIARHLAGAIALAAPAAIDQQAGLLPLDVDAGGIAAIQALIAESQRRDLWAFGQFCPRPHLPDQEQRGYVWLPFDASAASARLQTLGAQLIKAIDQLGSKIEARATHAVTRLPLARHRHTGRFGDLILSEQRIAIDQNPASALAALCAAYHENPSAGVPALPPPPQLRPQPARRPYSAGVTIARYNETRDVEDLIRYYGARAARRRGLYFCPFHPDEHASLSVYTHGRQRYCRCFSAHSDCPLAQHDRNDAFNVYCIGEGLDAKAALRRLNGWE